MGEKECSLEAWILKPQPPTSPLVLQKKNVNPPGARSGLCVAFTNAFCSSVPLEVVAVPESQGAAWKPETQAPTHPQSLAQTHTAL